MKIFAARGWCRHLSSVKKSGPRTIGSILSARVEKDFRSDALISCHQGIRLNFGRLYSAALAFASGLKRQNYRPGDKIAMLLKNCAENVIVQLGSSFLGVAVVTAKDAASLVTLASQLSCKGAVSDVACGKDASFAGAFNSPIIITGDCRDVKVSHVPFDEFLKSPMSVVGQAKGFDSSAPAAFYGARSAVTQRDLIQAAEAAQNHLQLASSDRLCLTITLNHSFGLGSGAAASTSVVHNAGARPVFPRPSACVCL